MSLITQCPACTTLFKVVPDQLRMSDGWVRCGQCDEVFDANANIRNDVAAAGAVPVQAGASVDNAESQGHRRAAVDISADDPADATLHAPLHGEVQAGSYMESDSLDEPAFAEADSEADPFLDKSPKELSEFSAAVSAAVSNEGVPLEAAPDESNAERRYMQMFAPDAPEHADPKLSFMKPVRPPSVWRRRWVRIALVLCSILLSVLVLLQVVVHERDRIAVQFPEFREELAGLCLALGQEIAPLRQIESVVIDSSAFSKIRNDVYKLSFTLRNTTMTPLATPAMELTLTDMQDQVLMRKVLTPSDFAAVPVVMSAGVEVSAMLPMSVRTLVPVERVSGYRLLAFYP